METLFGVQTYGITVTCLVNGTRTIRNVRPLPAPVIMHSNLETNPSPWQTLLSSHIAKFSTTLADIWVTSSSTLTTSGVEEFFYPSALNYKSVIYLTIMPTERYPCYSSARPISLALEGAESLLPRHNSQLILTGVTVATSIFKAFSLIGNIYISDKGLYANLCNPWHHANGACARDETPLYQCYRKDRCFPQCNIALTDWPECHKWDPILQRPYPWQPLVQAWSEAVYRWSEYQHLTPTGEPAGPHPNRFTMQTWMYPHALGLAPMGTIKTPVTLTFSAREVLDTILVGQYYWGRRLINNNNLYTFTSLAKGVGDYTWHKYLQERDQRALRTDPSDHIYHGSSYCHIVNFWGYNRLSDISKRSGTMRIIWDWSCHGGRLKRFAKTAEAKAVASKCPLCGQPDSQRHWILLCPDPASVRLRQACISKMESTVQTYMEGKHPPKKRIHMAAVELIAASFQYLILNHRHGHRATVGSFTKSFVTALRQSLGDTADLANFQSQEHTTALKYVVLTCGKILADHTHALWRQRTITGIQSYRALRVLHPDTLPSHIPLIPHADKGSLRQEQIEAAAKYATDNQLTEEEQGLFQSARDVMHKERRVAVGPQSAEAINGVITELQRTRIAFTSNTRQFRRRVTTPTQHPQPDINPIPQPPTSTNDNMAPPTGPPRYRLPLGIAPTNWTLTPTQQLQTDILLSEIARRSPEDSLRLPGLRPSWEIPVTELQKLRGTRQIANIIIDSFVTHWSLRSPKPTASTPSDLYLRLQINKSATLARPSADIILYGIPEQRLTKDHDLIVPLQLPGHWTVAIVQPYANKIVYYDGLRGDGKDYSYSAVIPVLMEWLTEAYSSADLPPQHAVSKWTVTFPSDSPWQKDGHNCGPNTLMYIYHWIMYRRLSTTADWDPSNSNPLTASQQVKAMRSFIAYHLITQGGLESSLKWVSSSPATTVAPSAVIESIRQAYSRVSQRAYNKSLYNPKSGAQHTESSTEDPQQPSPQTSRGSSHEIFDVG